MGLSYQVVASIKLWVGTKFSLLAKKAGTERLNLSRNATDESNCGPAGH